MPTWDRCFLVAVSLTIGTAPTHADSLGSQFDVNDFYKPFHLDEITPTNQQTWPYYKYVSVHWDDFSLHGTAKIRRSSNPAKLTVAEDEDRLDLRTDWRNGRTFLNSLHATQVKGFIVIKGNKILAEFYDNGFNVDDTQLLQSASKSYAGIVVSRFIDEGLLDPAARVAEYLPDFKGTAVGRATVQQVLDMTSGLSPVTDFHTPGAEGYLFEIEQGMKSGDPVGHRQTILGAEAATEPDAAWAYNDKNTDVLALLVEKVSGKLFPELLARTFDAFGANHDGSIALTSDGTTSPAYGVSTSLRDYGLFHQWIAEGKAPKSYYASLLDTDKDLFSKSDKADYFDEVVLYGSQSYYLPEHDVIYSQGSFGQNGYSDLRSGVSVVFMQDWATNTELDKYNETTARALAVIHYLRAQGDEGIISGRGI